MKVEAKIITYEKDTMKAFGTLTINDCIVIKNIRLVQGKNKKLFISMPRYKTMDQDGHEVWKDIAYAHTVEARKEIEEAVVEAYKFELEKWLNTQETIEVSGVKIVNKDNLKGLATIRVDGVTIKSIKILEGEKGLFVSMPQYKTTDQDGNEVWKDIVYPTNKWQRETITSKVLKMYEQVRKSPHGEDKREGIG